MKSYAFTKFITFKNKILQTSILTVLCLICSPSLLLAEVYPTGTFTVKPLNMNLANVFFGQRDKDSTFRSISRNLFTGADQPYLRETDAFKTPFSMGFHESDRNGYGYGIEIGYIIGWDTEIFARGGFSHEKGISKILVGERSLDFDDRTNYGFSIGARKYFDVDKTWRPFIGIVGGITRQDKTKAVVKDHFIGNFFLNDDVPVGKFQFLNHKTLYTFEVHAGTDYILHENLAISFSAAVRYGERGGSGTVTTPTANPPQNQNGQPRPITYSDHRDKWTIPVMVSLKIIL